TPLGDVTRFVQNLRKHHKARPSGHAPPEFVELTREIDALLRSVRPRTRAPEPLTPSSSTESTQLAADPEVPAPDSSLTRSGLHDSPPPEAGHRFDPHASGDYSTIDMVNRLEPSGLRWIESSPAEQEFLGWTLEELRQRSFLDVIYPEDRDRARETFNQALVRGEALGLIVPVRAGPGQKHAIEGNLGGRRR